ncbi:MAG TPA: alanine--tRNA ligase [Vicinamibacterales bacterium]
MTSSELRQSFLRFFERHGHRIVPSSPLVPHGDPTLLFTNAGMNQFKDVFLGRETRPYTRATSSQKCMRVSGKHNDLDNVGPSLRHHTFFEMLGNFSFGDYFKHDAIGFAWALLTGEWGLPADRLYATIFRGEDGIPRDDEAATRWRDFLPAERIAELGAADNFWSMGDTGPCGRCSEIHYFRGADLPCSAPVCLGPACDCDRFVEIWNNVFMEFDRQPDGSLQPLPTPSIDTGMGLERIAAVMRGTPSNYDTDVFAPLLAAIEREAGGRETPEALAREMTPHAVSTRVVADHLRAMTFLIADGVLPSNEWRGYVLRKIMRRAMRHGRRLGLTEPFLHRLADVLVEHMGDAYPELRTGRDTIAQVIRAEEARFDAVLTGGLPRLEELLDTAAASGGVVPGDEAFRLYDTWGLPLDFIEDLASERKLAFDREGFDRAMEAQREKARAKSAFDTRRAEEPQFADEAAAGALRAAGDVFEGYTTTEVPGARVIALFDARRRQVRTLPAGADGFVLLDRTPFYLESGGQISDRGDLRNEAGAVIAQVETVVRLGAGLPRAHKVTVLDELAEGQTVTAHVDEATRDATRRNHTATHLLHAALRQVLGPHVKQAGSLVAPDRLRFDFTHFAPLTDAQLREIERLVNEQILRNAAVGTEVKPLDEAMASGAMALFGEKYGDRVRVVSIPGFSMELCGGTHTRATGDIGLFTIVQESGVAAGVRRIDALTGEGALAATQRQRETLESVTRALNVGESQLPDAIARLQQEARRLAREVQELKVRLAAGGAGQGAGANGDTVDINGVTAVFRSVAGLDKHALRELSDTVKQQIRSGIVVLASDSGEGKVSIVAAVTPDLKGRVHAGNIVKALAPIVGGGGGGRPDFAEAGGRDASKIDAMLAEGRTVVEKMLAGS